MGYRSDVAIALRKDECDRFLAAAHAESLHPTQGRGENYDEYGTPDDLLDGAVRTEHDKGADGCWSVLQWEWTKWYDGFACVDFVMDYIRSVRERDFLRIGENTDDVEHESTLDFWLLDVERRIRVY